MNTIAIKTVVFIAIFAIAYMLFIIRKTARRQLDLYDLVMLSTVAIVPSAFVFHPRLAYLLADIAGVEFPFVVMFGMLFAVLFIFIHRMTVKIHRLESDSRMLIQELSLLKRTIELADDRKSGVIKDGSIT